MRHTERQSPKHVVVALCASVVLAGCSASRQGTRGQYEQSRDSATQASLSRPSLGCRRWERRCRWCRP